MTWMKRVTARPCGAKAVKHFGPEEHAHMEERATRDIVSTMAVRRSSDATFAPSHGTRKRNVSLQAVDLHI